MDASLFRPELVLFLFSSWVLLLNWSNKNVKSCGLKKVEYIMGPHKNVLLGHNVLFDVSKISMGTSSRGKRFLCSMIHLVCNIKSSNSSQNIFCRNICISMSGRYGCALQIHIFCIKSLKNQVLTVYKLFAHICVFCTLASIFFKKQVSEKKIWAYPFVWGTADQHGGSLQILWHFLS